MYRPMKSLINQRTIDGTGIGCRVMVFHTPNMNDKDINDSENDSDTLQQCSTD
jgi:hypothetical protein